MTATAVEAATPEFVHDVVRGALASVLEIAPSSLGPDTVLADIEADSLVLVEVAEIVEERLAPYARRPLRIPDADLERLQTLGQVVDYLQPLL